jgi:hypothetical protein
LEIAAYSLLELGKILGAQRIGLCYNWNQIDPRAQALHDLNIQWLKGVAGGADEVEAGMNTEIDLLGSAWLLFLEHVRLMLVVEELNDGLP